MHYTTYSLVKGEEIDEPEGIYCAVPTSKVAGETIVQYQGESMSLRGLHPIKYRTQKHRLRQGKFVIAYYKWNPQPIEQWEDFTSPNFNGGNTCSIPATEEPSFISDIAMRFEKEKAGQCWNLSRGKKGIKVEVLASNAHS